VGGVGREAGASGGRGVAGWRVVARASGPLLAWFCGAPTASTQGGMSCGCGSCARRCEGRERVVSVRVGKWAARARGGRRPPRSLSERRASAAPRHSDGSPSTQGRATGPGSALAAGFGTRAGQDQSARAARARDSR
jgi:hypothetical protein